MLESNLPASSRVFVADEHVSKSPIDTAVSESDNLRSSTRDRIVIVEEDRWRAQALAAVVAEACPPMEIVCYYSVATARAGLHEGRARLGLLGLTFADGDGLDLLDDMSTGKRTDRLLVVSPSLNERGRQCLSQANINGFFNRASESVESLGHAVGVVLAGGRYFSPAPVGLKDNRPTLWQIFTETEQLVFAILGGGADDGEAGELLQLSASTVHSHRQKIMRKLGVQNRAQLMREALRRGVVRFTDSDQVLYPGFARSLANRKTRSRAPFPVDHLGVRR